MKSPAVKEGATKERAVKGPAVKSQAAPARRSFAWLQGLACGALATLATPEAVLLCVLLAPGILSLLLDREPGKPVARTVLLFGLAFSVEPVRTLWLGSMSMAEAAHLLSDLSVTGLAWAAAAGGWLLAELAPLVVGLVLDLRSRSQAAALRKLRAQHAEAWGLPGLD